jgi:adenosylmethionine-8-amino-7-oxononanoate aminotransferase
LHSHSYTGNPLACAAALACLDLFASENVLERNLQRAHDLASAFVWTKTDDRTLHLRQQGMILAFDVVHDALHKPSTFAREVFTRGIEEGVLVRPIGSTVYVMPPYILSADETMEMGQRIQRVVEDVLHTQKP